MKLSAKILTGIAALFLVGQAHAGFMLEPFAGYGMGEYKFGTIKEDVSGTEFGLRLGGTFTMFSYGFEYAMGSATVDSTPETDIDFNDMGVFVGFDFPILVRAYATYMFKSESENDSNEYKGNGLRLGIGYTGLPFVSINLERVSRTYDEDKDGALATDIKVNMTVLSLSIPLP